MIRKIIIFTSFLLSVLGTVVTQVINKVEPLLQWAGMRDLELQLMVYGDHISEYYPVINESSVYLRSCATVDSLNYLILCLDLSRAHSGIFDITFVNGEKELVYAYELKECKESTDGIQGYDSSDVLHLIMPDRFVNGDQSNDQVSISTEYAMDRSKSGARHGGDLKGIEDHSDYFVDLGVTAIWLNPVLENDGKGGSYHGYSSTDIFHADKRLRSNEDYLRLMNKAHQKGLRIVMDAIFNHIGADRPWALDVPFKDWFNVSPSERGNHAKAIFYDNYASIYDSEVMKYVGFGISSNQANPHVGKYLIQNSIWWIEYVRTDAIRQDTYPYSDFDMMREWNIQIMNEYPQFNTAGEIWINYTIGTAWWREGCKLNFGKDTEPRSVMDFTLMSITSDIFNDKSSPGGRLDKIYDHLCYDFAYLDIKNALRFSNNHDTDKLLCPEPKDLDGYKQGVAFSLTIPGTPQSYHGHELLTSGTKSRPGGDGNIRLDVPGGWSGDSQDWFTREGCPDLQNKIWNYSQTLLKWRKGNKIISEGNMKYYIPQLGVHVYERYLEGKGVMVIINGANHEVDLPLARYKKSLKEGIEGKDIITKRTTLFKDSLKLASKEALVAETN